MKRVVVTGLGLITPLGTSVASSWSKLINANSGIRKIPPTFFSTADLQTSIAGLVPFADENDGFILENHVSAKESKKMDRFIHYAIAASNQAIADSGIELKTEEQQQRAGVLIGSGIGGLGVIAETAITMQEKGPRRVSPFFIPQALINLASGHVSITHNLKGPVHSVVTACATGSHAIGDAANLIRLGDADIMVAGGTEAAVCRVGIAGFNACRALSTGFNDHPEMASRPWDKDRDGFVMGEGSGIMVLEEYEHAKKRGAKIYAELVGYALTGDAYHITAPSEDGDGGFRAMKIASSKAKINPEDIDYINAHGTSTPLGDMIELNAVQRFLGVHANKKMMSSTKSSIGHLLGSAGSVEAIFSILAMRDNIVPPTLNLYSPPEDCALDLVPHKAKEHKSINVVLSNSFGFGGTNASLIFKRVV